MTESFLLYNKGSFYKIFCIFPFLLTNSENYSQIRRQIGTYVYIQSLEELPYSE